MAILYPPLEAIQRLKVPPTQGERKLLEVLVRDLDDNYEIFFQPFVNGDNPDFAILRKESGVILIEVKDWNLNYYKVQEKFEWRLKNNNCRIVSPFEQLRNYKDNLFHLHIEGLNEKIAENNLNRTIIGCAVYFHGSTMDDFLNFVNLNLSRKSAQEYLNEIKSYAIVTEDNLSYIHDLPKKFRMDVKSKLFDDALYARFVRTLKPPFHYEEQGIDIEYSKAQLRIIESSELQRRKIKGVAGSGKSLVLAKRAVNAHKITGEKVLILTYNLALRNYIRDRISDVREDFYWSNFYITNYHQFFMTQANNFNLSRKGISCFNNVHFFKGVKDSINRFKAVFIDEIQDYRQEWIDLILEYFVEKNGSEIMVFGDEKQNIYDRPLDQDKEIIVRQVPGKWNQTLNIAYRYTADIAHLVFDYQDEFLANKYKIERSLDENTPKLPLYPTGPKDIYYTYLGSNNPDNITKTIFWFLRKYSIHSSDCAVLGSLVKNLRLIERRIRLSEKEKTTITFETQEEYNKILNECMKENPLPAFSSDQLDSFALIDDDFNPRTLIESKIEIIRRGKKVHFNMGTGTIKISTIHSFKGWESHTVILLVGNQDENKHENTELIYTGLTRARKNIVIINLGNPNIHNFFLNQIKKKQVNNLDLN